MFARRPPPAEVSLSLASPSLVPSEVTHIVGLVPSSTFAKGDPAPWTGNPRPWGVWRLSVQGDDVEPAAEALLAAVDGREDALRAAATACGATIAVGIWWEPEGGMGGYTLGAETVRKLAALGERIDFRFVSRPDDTAWERVIRRLEAFWEPEDGALWKVRQGQFEEAELRRLLAELSAITIEEEALLPRRLVSLLWYLPAFLLWQVDRVREEGGDTAAYARISAELEQAVTRLLGVP